MGFITPTDDEKNAEEELIGPGEWKDIQGMGDVSPNENITVKTTVDSTKYFLEKYSVFVDRLRVSLDDAGSKLGVDNTCTLISTIIKTIETLKLVGPPQLPKNLKKPLNYFNKILSKLELLDDDDNDDKGDRDNGDVAIPPEKPIDPKGKQIRRSVSWSELEFDRNIADETPDPFLDQAERDFNLGVQRETPESYFYRMEEEWKRENL
jgi:hypothetical protein